MDWARKQGGRVVRSGFRHGLTVCFSARSQEGFLWLSPMRCWRAPNLQLTLHWTTGERRMSLLPTDVLSRILSMNSRRHRESWTHGYQLCTQHRAWARKLLAGGATSSLRQINALQGNRRCGLRLERERLTLQLRFPVKDPDRLCQLVELGLDVGDQLGLQDRGQIEMSNEVVDRENGGLHCPVCSGALEHQVVYCLTCGAPHHLDCWRYLGRCSLFGCQSTRHQRRRKWLPSIGGVLAARSK